MMARKGFILKFSVLFILMLFITVISGCSKVPGNNPAEATPTVSEVSMEPTSTTAPLIKTMEVGLFFPTKDNSALALEKRSVKASDDTILDVCIQELMKGPEIGLLSKAIPDGTKLLNAKMEGDVASLDFSKEYTKVNDIAEIVERLSIVNTLTDLEGVRKVRIKVEGKDLIGPSGMPFGDMEKASLNENYAGEARRLKLYFGNDNADAVVPEDREVLFKKNSLEKTIMNELLKGPTKKGLHPSIPKGTKVLSLEVNDGLLKLNLSKEFLNNGGSAGEYITVNSIVNSFTELPYVKKVQFLIEGKVKDVYIHMVFDKPFERDPNSIKLK